MVFINIDILLLLTEIDWLNENKEEINKFRTTLINKLNHCYIKIEKSSKKYHPNLVHY